MPNSRKYIILRKARRPEGPFGKGGQKQAMQIRLDKYLADMGVGTRSEVKQYIRKKQVQVNGSCPSGASQKVDTKKDRVLFQGLEILYS